MKNKIAQLKNTWTYNHKTLIIALALGLAHIYPAYIAPHMPTLPTYAATIEHVNLPQMPPQDALMAKIEARTLEIYKALEPVNKERARQEALREMSDELLQMSYNSPYVDYEAIREAVAQ
jgi:hypothetical protein